MKKCSVGSTGAYPKQAPASIPAAISSITSMSLCNTHNFFSMTLAILDKAHAANLHLCPFSHSHLSYWNFSFWSRTIFSKVLLNKIESYGHMDDLHYPLRSISIDLYFALIIVISQEFISPWLVMRYSQFHLQCFQHANVGYGNAYANSAELIPVGILTNHASGDVAFLILPRSQGYPAPSKSPYVQIK